MKWNKAGLLALGVILFTGMVASSWAQEDESGSTDLIKSRTYIGIMGTSATIDQWGGFTGNTYFVSTSSSGSTAVYASEKDLVPTINRNYGWGALVGHREGPWAAELSFSRTDHSATFFYSGPATFITPATLCDISIDFKRYFLTALPVQPFVQMGLSLPWLWVRQGSYLFTDQTLTTQIGVDDETISGIGFNLGAGLDIYFSQDIAIMAGAYQRWTSFDQINGAAKIPFNDLYYDGNPDDTGAIEGDGLHLYVGTTFGFQM